MHTYLSLSLYIYIYTHMCIYIYIYAYLSWENVATRGELQLNVAKYGKL